MLEISAERITIDLRKIIHKDYSVHYLPILEDQLTLYYTGQELCFCAVDGDNVKLPALVEWIKSIQYAFVIPNDNICFISVSPSLPQWRWIPFYLEAFEHVVNLLECYNIDIELNQAKFVGVLVPSAFPKYIPINVPTTGNCAGIPASLHASRNIAEVKRARADNSI
jgi:hypothetical protein